MTAKIVLKIAGVVAEEGTWTLHPSGHAAILGARLARRNAGGWRSWPHVPSPVASIQRGDQAGRSSLEGSSVSFTASPP